VQCAITRVAVPRRANGPDPEPTPQCPRARIWRRSARTSASRPGEPPGAGSSWRFRRSGLCIASQSASAETPHVMGKSPPCKRLTTLPVRALDCLPAVPGRGRVLLGLRHRRRLGAVTRRARAPSFGGRRFTHPGVHLPTDRGPAHRRRAVTGWIGWLRRDKGSRAMPRSAESWRALPDPVRVAVAHRNCCMERPGRAACWGGRCCACRFLCGVNDHYHAARDCPGQHL
jgi:hypothetical protein